MFKIIQYIALALVLCALFVVAAIVGNKVTLASVDVAHHYALVARLFEYWSMPTSIDPSLGEMNFYPKYAHVLAAAFGVVFSSPFMGLHVAGLLALFVLWYALADILRSQADVELALQTSIFLACVWVACISRFEIHGIEIVVHYFYPQLVAQALMFFALAAWARMQACKLGAVVRYGFLSVCSVLIVGFHLLPAIELLGVLVVIISIDFFLSNRKSKVALLIGLSSIIIAAISIWLHPSFSAMKTIASNNGDLLFKFTPNLKELAVLCGMVLLLSMYGLYGSIKNNLQETWKVDAIGLISSYGIVVSSLCALQYIALAFGYGSEYACKKYGFGLNTVLILLVSLIATKLLIKQLHNPIWIKGLKKFGAAIRPFTIVLFLFMGLLVFRSIQGDVNITRVIEVETSVSQFYSRMPTQQGDRRDIAFGISDIGNVGNYLFSIGSLHHPRDDIAMDVLRGRSPLDLAGERYLITSGGNHSLNFSECRKFELEGELVVEDAECVAHKAEQCLATHCDERKAKECKWSTDFSQGGTVGAIQLEGFGQAEVFGRWTVSKKAQFSCYIPPEVLTKLSGIRLVLATGFIPTGAPQKAKISVSGSAPRDIEQGVQLQEYIFNVDPKIAKGVLDITFDIPNAKSPKDFGINQDTRPLGLGLNKIELITK